MEQGAQGNDRKMQPEPVNLRTQKRSTRNSFSRDGEFVYLGREGLRAFPFFSLLWGQMIS
jgi:hypothetical protein